MKNLIVIIILSFVSTFVNAQDTLSLVIQFGYNERTPSLDYSNDLAALSETEILSIVGYASVEGDNDRNYKLAADRALSVYNLLLENAESFDYENADVYGLGGTTAFGKALYENRVVVITFVTSSTYYKNLKQYDMLDSMPVGKSLFSEEMYENTDTLELANETVVNNIIEPVVLETITPSIENELSLETSNASIINDSFKVVSTIKADRLYKLAGLDENERKEKISNSQFFVNPVTKKIEQLDSTQIGIKILPIKQAVRHYMKKGMSREEAENIVYGRETYFNFNTGNWDKIDLKPTSKKKENKSRAFTVKTNNKTKVRLKKTKGLSAKGGILNKLFPYRNC